MAARSLEWRGKPFAIRVDNGPEYVSGKLTEWAETQGIALSHIQPGKPQQNAYVERYNRTVRHEWLDQYIIETIEEAQEFATQWLWTYNNERPNMGIDGITPAQELKWPREFYCGAQFKTGDYHRRRLIRLCWRTTNRINARTSFMDLGQGSDQRYRATT